MKKPYFSYNQLMYKKQHHSMLFLYFSRETKTQVEPEYEKLKILSEYIIGFSEWLKEERLILR